MTKPTDSCGGTNWLHGVLCLFQKHYPPRPGSKDNYTKRVHHNPVR
jgi:hypothetical protein